MWGVDDEIRGMVKEVIASIPDDSRDVQHYRQKVEAALEKINEMIFKEENIMLPMLLNSLAPDEWAKIAGDERELGFCLIQPPPEWKGKAVQAQRPAGGENALQTPTGSLELKEIIGMLDTIPMDITFVDKDDTVQYFSEGTERIFPRTKAIIGRKVVNCHPPASMHIVENILADFKAGKKSHEDFWLSIGGKFILIRYYAVHGTHGEYLGTLEVTQDIGPIQKITGEKRLVSDA
jgi:DUF438 domain-containing protein